MPGKKKSSLGPVATDPIAMPLALPKSPSYTDVRGALAKAFPGHGEWRAAVPHREFGHVLVAFQSVNQLHDGVVITLHPMLQLPAQK